MQRSHIQQSIISKLKNAQSMRYRDLHDSEIDRDLFNYHLRQLVEKGIIKKVSFGRYTLSEKGQAIVADIEHTSDTSNRLFKINVLLIVIDKRPDGIFVLNQKRGSQPSYGIVGIPGGTIKKAEPLQEAATRKLLEETGVSAAFDLLCTTRRILYKNDELFSDVLFPICIATSHKGTPVATKFGENFWVPIDEAIENDSRQGDRIDAIADVLAAIRIDHLSEMRGNYSEQISRL